MRRSQMMKHSRRSIRLQNYDYSQEGMYFVTICTYEKEYLFGEIKSDCRGTISCALNKEGKVVEQCWKEIINHYDNVDLDEFIIMPNHIHGIICITHNVNQKHHGNQNHYGVQKHHGVQKHYGVQDIEPLRNEYQKTISGSIGSIIRGFKIGATKWFRKNTDIYQVWQRNYYEHIIRDERDLNRIREYIILNPHNWEEDKYNE